jgi:hypothetical protein
VSAWKITLLSLTAGIGTVCVAGGMSSIARQVGGDRAAIGGELGIGIGVMILVATALLFSRWRVKRP